MTGFIQTTASALSAGLSVDYEGFGEVAGEVISGTVLQLRRVGPSLAEITVLRRVTREILVQRLDAGYPVRVFAAFLQGDPALRDERDERVVRLERRLVSKLEGNRWGFGGLPVE